MSYGHAPYSSVPYATVPTGGPKLGVATFAGAGVLTAVAVRIVVASATLVGVGVLSATPVRIRQASATFGGVGTLAATPSLVHVATATLAGKGVLTATPLRITKATSGGWQVRLRRPTLRAPTRDEAHARSRRPAPVLLPTLVRLRDVMLRVPGPTGALRAPALTVPAGTRTIALRAPVLTVPGVGRPVLARPALTVPIGWLSAVLAGLDALDEEQA